MGMPIIRIIASIGFSSPPNPGAWPARGGASPASWSAKARLEGPGEEGPKPLAGKRGSKPVRDPDGALRRWRMVEAGGEAEGTCSTGSAVSSSTVAGLGAAAEATFGAAGDAAALGATGDAAAAEGADVEATLEGGFEAGVAAARSVNWGSTVLGRKRTIVDIVCRTRSRLHGPGDLGQPVPSLTEDLLLPGLCPPPRGRHGRVVGWWRRRASARRVGRWKVGHRRWCS